MTEPTRVIIVDDQALVRRGLARVLCEEEGFEIVAEAADGAGIVALTRRTQPDVIVLDMRMPRVDGAATLRALRVHEDAPPVLVLTTFGEDQVLSAALRAGAAGFLLKDAPGEEIVRAVHAVARGEGYLDPAVTARVLASYRTSAAQNPDEIVHRLSARELDVLVLMSRGSSNEEIGASLFISTATVKTHVRHIFEKLNVRDRPAAIVMAFDHGVVAPAQSNTSGPLTPPRV